MSHLLDDDDDLHGHNHRELTLSTGTVLGIFLALALSWALFFGFGYKMGNKSRQSLQASTAGNSSANETDSTSFNNFKPAPGSSSGTYATPPASNTTQQQDTNTPPPSAITPPPSTPTAATETPAQINLPSVSPSATPPPAATNGSFVVQIAAVSHKEDATLLVNALRSKGYAVTAQPQSDNLIHVQVGPFASRKQADSMRQQLLTDGYNAIVK